MLFISSAYAQTAPAAAAGGGDMMSSLTGMLPLVLMFVVLYFVMILHIEIANGVEVQMQRSAVVQVLPKGTVK